MAKLKHYFFHTVRNSRLVFRIFSQRTTFSIYYERMILGVFYPMGRDFSFKSRVFSFRRLFSSIREVCCSPGWTRIFKETLAENRKDREDYISLTDLLSGTGNAPVVTAIFNSSERCQTSNT